MPQRWTRRPEGSNWGDFGPDDQLGRLNLLTPERVRAAAREIREGITFCLSLPLDRPGGNALSPSRFPPVLRPTLRNGRVRMNYRVSDDDPDATDLICDDAAVLHTQYSTHWDAFSHVGFMFDADGDGVSEPRYYNGFRAGEDIVGPNDPSDAGRHRRIRGQIHLLRQIPGHRRHGRQRRAGPRRDDRSASRRGRTAHRHRL